MKKIVILDNLTLGDDIDTSVLEQFGEVTRYERTLPHETFKRLDGVHIVITNKVVIDRPLLEALPSLELICVAATGMNNIDLEVAKERGIEVKNVAGYSTAGVVQTTFTLLFTLLGNARYFHDFTRTGGWITSPVFTHIGPSFTEIAGKKWGIIGMGAIGQAVARVASSFGCDVIYTSTSGMNTNQPYPCVSLQDLLVECDIISIHAPLNEKTQGLIGENEFSLIKHRAVLLNLGRGGIIDEEALSDALSRHNIFVGLDVIDGEPMRHNHPLVKWLSDDRVVIFPHIAWAGIQSRKRLFEEICHNIATFLGIKQ